MLPSPHSGCVSVAPLCVLCEGSCFLPRIHDHCFLIRKVHLVILDASPWLLRVCFGRAHAPFPELAFVCFLVGKAYILFDILDVSPWLLRVCPGKAHTTFPELTFVCF